MIITVELLCHNKDRFRLSLISQYNEEDSHGSYDLSSLLSKCHNLRMLDL